MSKLEIFCEMEVLFSICIPNLISNFSSKITFILKESLFVKKKIKIKSL